MAMVEEIEKQRWKDEDLSSLRNSRYLRDWLIQSPLNGELVDF